LVVVVAAPGTGLVVPLVVVVVVVAAVVALVKADGGCNRRRQIYTKSILDNKELIFKEEGHE
jgi:hypothetical protein